MSFVDNVDLESQTPYSDSPEFDQLNERISTSLFDINSSLGTLHSHLKALGKKNSSHSIEERAVSLAEDLRHEFKELSDLIKELAEWEDPAPAQKFTQQKLSREFSTALTEFQDLQRQLAEKQRKSILLAKEQQEQNKQMKSSSSNLVALDEEDQARQHEEDEENDVALQQEQEEEQNLINQHELEYHNRLIQERETEIQGIEQGIEELNEIFSDLGRIVTEQGSMIDNIEANVYNIAGSTRNAATELTKASRYQRNARGRALCLLIILVVILAVILLAVLI